MRSFLKTRFWLLPILVLAACAGELNTPGEALRLLGGSLQDAYLFEQYEAALRPAGGLRPYDFELGSGDLPEGLALEGGVIRGIPRELGTFTFTVTVTDANLSSTFLEHRLRVSELPEPVLDVVMPLTEVRAPFTVRVGIEEARNLQGASSRLRWDPAQFTYVEGSFRVAADSFAAFSETGDDWLQVDLAWLGSTFTGERQLFTFQLAPLAPARPGLNVLALFPVSPEAEPVFTEANFGARVPQLSRQQPVPVPEASGLSPEAEDPTPAADPAGDAEGDEQ